MSDVKEKLGKKYREMIDEYGNPHTALWVSIEKLSEKESEIERLRNNLNQAIEALEKIDSMEYEVNYGHTHMLYDAKMYARVTLNSIKGGETDATQTSSRS